MVDMRKMNVKRSYYMPKRRYPAYKPDNTYLVGKEELKTEFRDIHIAEELSSVVEMGRLLWCCRSPWAALNAYHQVTHLFV